MSDLYVAAGGGGDPIGTLIAARTVTVDPAPPLIATYAWERPEVDPTARPLGQRDFTGLTREAGGTAFTSATRARPPAGSTMPGLARDLPVRLLLLDPAQGLFSLSRQIEAMAEAAGDRIRVIDIGGDILTHGDEPTLRSPFGDAFTLAACHLAGIPTTVYVAGPGLDGEIDEQLLLKRLTGRRPLTPGRDAASAAGPALAWHPSEASALWAAAIHGARGTVRTVHHTVRLTSVSPRLYHLPLRDAIDHNPVAQALLDERPATLEAAAALSHRLTGIHGLAPERDRAPHDQPHAGSTALLDQDQAMKTLREAADGADHVTLRYAARTLDLPWTAIPSLREVLGSDMPLLRLT
ncbi:DUF1152 domain-containing protein [Streptomyces sp. AC602_WCS936]|uniref:DUF1152 domain-containing protein n=1 Tax=Streptomyces sp. AC602_WCS936 TaxID=2823685 RepID=UPI001C2660DE|nr:DUF1152 domain-containing protein [Streptomyces sp. AC602_WCS936]